MVAPDQCPELVIAAIGGRAGSRTPSARAARRRRVATGRIAIPSLRAKYIKGRAEERPSRPRAGSEFTVRQACEAEGAVGGKHQGAALDGAPPRRTVPLARPRAAQPEASLSCLERQRIDKWLWHARVVRTRSAAAALAACGHVRINGERIDASSHAVRAGDVVTVALDRSVRVLKVRGFAERRGSADDAREICEFLDPPTRPGRTPRHRPAGAWHGPATKRDRRATRGTGARVICRRFRKPPSLACWWPMRTRPLSARMRRHIAWRVPQLVCAFAQA